MPLVPSVRALRLLAAQQGLGPVACLAEVRSVAGLRVDVHVPAGPAHGTVVCLHDGAALLRAPAALAAIGVRVLAVHLPSGPERAAPRADDVARVLDAVARDPHLAPTGRVAVLAPASVVGPALLAAARAEVAARVSGVLAVGLPTDVAAVVDGVGGLQAPVTILVGTADPAGAVTRLAGALAAGRVPLRVCRTRLLDAGARPTLRAASEVPDLLDALDGWLDDVDGAVRVARAA